MTDPGKHGNPTENGALKSFPPVAPKATTQAVAGDRKSARFFAQTPIKKKDTQETKKPCNNMQGPNLAAQGLDIYDVTTISSKDLPQIGKSRFPEKFPTGERYKLIVELCLGLDLYEIEALIGSLQAIAERKIEDALIVR